MNGLTGENSRGHLCLAASDGNLTSGFEAVDQLSHIFTPDLTEFIKAEAVRLGQDVDTVMDMIVDHYKAERDRVQQGFAGPVFLEGDSKDEESMEFDLVVGVTRNRQRFVPELLPRARRSPDYE